MMLRARPTLRQLAEVALPRLSRKDYKPGSQHERGPCNIRARSETLRERGGGGCVD